MADNVELRIVLTEEGLQAEEDAAARSRDGHPDQLAGSRPHTTLDKDADRWEQFLKEYRAAPKDGMKPPPTEDEAWEQFLKEHEAAKKVPGPTDATERDYLREPPPVRPVEVGTRPPIGEEGEGALAGEGAAAGGAGGIAAGAVGAVAAAGVAALEAVAMTAHALRPVVHEAGAITSEMAGNRNVEAITRGVDDFARVIEKTGLVGQAFGEVLQLGTESVRTFTGVVDAFVHRGTELAQYSGELSAAGARADVRSIQADIRESQELGPDLARLTDEQSRFYTELRELLLPIKKFLVEELADIMHWVVDELRSWEPTIIAIIVTLETGFQAMVAALHFDFDKVGKLWEGLPKKIADAIADTNRNKEPEEVGLNQLMQLVNQRFQSPNAPHMHADPRFTALDQMIHQPVLMPGGR
ncbi:MAG TPA: hypothetical protein VFA18_18530 [Gemmataceae bacterium]|nr:hypothetical protein [Gemmataceae bacterium]